MSRKFSSYGPIDKDLHYYVPRQVWVDQIYQELGADPTKGAHYLTVWAPRQQGKTWLLLEVVKRLKAEGNFEVAFASMQSAKDVTRPEDVLSILVSHLRYYFNPQIPEITRWQELPSLFTRPYFEKPVILILDEFDALHEEFINKFANEFRTMYTERMAQADVQDKRYLLHGLALLGVRSVLGIENSSGSPFNVQRSIHIPNLTREEVASLFEWYARDSGQSLEAGVVERIFDEFQGQPGLTCWFGELLTETYNRHQPTITRADMESAYQAAIYDLPNNNILNIVSKAQLEPYKTVVLEMFRTDQAQTFSYDDKIVNYLYLNGVVDREVVKEQRYLKFPNPFVQKRLFNYFARESFRDVGRLFDPFEDLSDTITENSLHIKPLLRRYEAYLQQHREWLLKDAPRRHDLRVYEAVYHFNLYMYLRQFLRLYDGQVYPEFPTGNGKIDLIIQYEGNRYAMELKSFSTYKEYQKSLLQSANYGQQLGLTEITLAIFVERLDDANRAKYEAIYQDTATGVTVIPVLVETK